MDINLSMKQPEQPEKLKTVARERSWPRASGTSRVIFRRELLEAADSVALQTARKAAPVPQQDGAIFEGKTSFTALGVHAQICDLLERKLRIRNPTFIQERVIPMIFQGHDVILKAQTGSGKTLAFLLPVLTQLLVDYEQQGATAFRRESWSAKVLIVSPTKELAMQSEKVTRVLLSRTMLVSGSLTGAVPRDKEKASLRKGVTVISGTPGRIIDHLNQTSAFNLINIATLVLDECDQLISHGFSSALQTILAAAREANPRLQIILASATADQRVLDFVRSYVREALPIGDLFGDTSKDPTLRHKDEQAKSVMPVSLDQRFCIVPTKMRLALLISALALETGRSARGEGSKRILVFAETKDVCTLLNELLMRLSEAESGDDHLIQAKVFHLHGSLNTEDRQIVWKKFLDVGGIMVATDVAARGLNLGSSNAATGQAGVDLVIQFEAPSSCEQYVHRVGRAGRMGQRGRSVLFLLESEAELIPLLSNYGISIVATPVDALAEGVLDFKKPIRLMERVQTRVEELVSGDRELKRMALQAFCMYVRGYSMKASDMRHIFRLKSLHLGHVAKGFGLTEPPSKVLQEFRPSKRQIKEARAERIAKLHGVKMKDRVSQRPKTKFEASERDNRRVFEC